MQLQPARPQPIRTNGVHLSHISSAMKWGRRPRTFSITGWQAKHVHTHARTQDKHANKTGHTHSRTHVCLRAEEGEGCMGWTFLSGDSYRTTSNSKSNLHNSPPSCTVYYTAFPPALQLCAPHSDSPLRKKNKTTVFTLGSFQWSAEVKDLHCFLLGNHTETSLKPLHQLSSLLTMFSEACFGVSRSVMIS